MILNQEFITDCIEDTSFNGKCSTLFDMIEEALNQTTSEENITKMKELLVYVGFDNVDNMSRFEVRANYSKLI